MEADILFGNIMQHTSEKIAKKIRAESRTRAPNKNIEEGFNLTYRLFL
jgi:hypothetical protein